MRGNTANEVMLVAGSSAVARRYAPFLLLAAVQALLVAVVPSTGGPGSGSTLRAGPGTGGDDDEFVSPLGELANGGSGGGSRSTTVRSGGGSGGADGSDTGTDGSSGGPGGGPGPEEPGRLTEDRSKCAPDGVRQQDVTLNSPPCVPRWVGDNGGATYQGVTEEEVVVLRYRGNLGAQVEAILRTQGLASTPEEEKAAQDAFAAFFEKHYEFYGRKIRWEWVQGTCAVTPPVASCFRDEAKTLNKRFLPFAVFWTNATVQGEFFDEWSRLGVVNLGGWHFNADFNQLRRPFHWDVFMDGTRAARNVAEYWCKKMQGKNATLSPTMAATRRKVGIITQDYEPTKKNGYDFIRYVSGEMCGTPADVLMEPFLTPSDITRAQDTATAAMERFQDEGVTTVVMMTDPIGPRFFTQAASAQRYYPEHLLAGTGLIDYDLLGRLYDTSQWRNAFGPGHLADPIPFKQTDASRAAADVGVSEVYSGANLLYAYMALVASQVQMAGPTLTPDNLEAGTLSLPAGGGWERTRNPASVLVKFGPGDYTAIEDSRHTYFSPDAISKIDGRPGAYLALSNGQRWEIGTWPVGEPRQ